MEHKKSTKKTANSETISTNKTALSRRDFISGAAAAFTGITIVPRHVLGGNGHTAPSEKLNIAGIGIGGMGKNNLENVSSENIVALCDVDEEYAGKIFEKYPQAKKYTDYRKMLEKQKDIDAVIIATPDHTHAVISMAAMQLGKHVYCQKPLTHSVFEARRLTEAARRYKVTTQMGNQGHSGEGVRLICEWIADGAIGPVRQVLCWTDRPIWPQGIDRPTDTPPVPSTLDWDLWLGPAALRPYHPAYTPFKWRGWWDFGTGAIGDMACHILDPSFWALKLGNYKRFTIEASSTKVNNESAPVASVIHYDFPAQNDMPAVNLHWYDGGLKPQRPEELEPGRKMGGGDCGTIFVGDKGKIMCGTYGENPRIIPETKMKAYKLPPKTLPRVEGTHEQDWVRACKEDRQACSNFGYSGPFTEMALLGNVAIRAGQKLEWDVEQMQVTNVPEANQYVRREYRQGWTL